MELAQEIVKSELLVSEDEDFINNFILSEDTLEEYKKAGESGGSVLGDVLLFSGSLAAVAGSIQLINSSSYQKSILGAVFFFSERTRLAATAAAILPSALATASSVRLGARWLSYSYYGYSSPLGQGGCVILFKAIPSLLIP